VVLLIVEYFTQKVNINLKILRILGKKRRWKLLLYDNIKKICLEKKIAISEMERDLGFPRSYVCKWNENEPGIRKVQKVADYLHVSIEELLEE
jgi:hypothetical protein